MLHLLRHDRAIAVAGLLSIVLLSWAYLWAGAGMSMPAMAGMAMPKAEPVWTPGYLALTFVMWAIMMAAMMLPTASPMLLLYDAMARRRSQNGAAIGSTSLFGLGYLAVWIGFSVGGVILQYGFHRAALISPMMEATSVVLAGTLLVGAGLYQWTPLKQACLRRCRSPLDFLMTQWRNGRRGALIMGLRHGAHCLGCCWALMLLLFVGGVMNLAWIAGIAIYVLVEKLVPHGPALSKAMGFLLVLWGLAVLAARVAT